MSSSPNQGEIIPPESNEAAAQRLANETVQPQRRARGRNVFAAPATYVLVGINCAVFVWMVLHGASIREPSIGQLLRYGATNPQLILNGQWWRLVTAIFVHVGFLHIATNMWCLWNLGLLGEPLLGPFGLVAVYVLTGVSGNLLSLAANVMIPFFRNPDAVGAGASGAVFGIAGILIVLLSNHKLPIRWSELQRLRRSVIQFTGLNLVIGIAANFTSIVNIDNFAHVGGFLCGLAMGIPLVPRMTSGRVRYLRRQKFTFAGFAFLLALMGYYIASLKP